MAKVADSDKESNDRPVLEEIEITPAMIEAGVKALYEGMGGRLPNVFPSWFDRVKLVYRAMRHAELVN